MQEVKDTETIYIVVTFERNYDIARLYSAMKINNVFLRYYSSSIKTHGCDGARRAESKWSFVTKCAFHPRRVAENIALVGAAAQSHWSSRVDSIRRDWPADITTRPQTSDHSTDGNLNRYRSERHNSLLADTKPLWNRTSGRRQPNYHQRPIQYSSLHQTNVFSGLAKWLQSQ